MIDAPKVEVDDGLNASGALVISCFPSIGFVSSIVAHYLVDKLELELVKQEMSLELLEREFQMVKRILLEFL